MIRAASRVAPPVVLAAATAIGCASLEPPAEPPRAPSTEVAVVAPARGGLELVRAESNDQVDSRCHGVGGQIFCYRFEPRPSDLFFARYVRFDAGGGPSRAFEGIDTTSALLSDGAAVYVATIDAVIRLPQGKEAPKIVHALDPKRRGSIALAPGQVWQQLVECSDEECVSLITGTRFGESTPFIAAAMNGPTMDRDNFFVGPGVRAMVAGRPAQLVVWRGDTPSGGSSGQTPEQQHVPLPPHPPARQPHPLYLPEEARVLVTFDETETYVLAPRESGYSVLAIAADAALPRLLHEAQDHPKQLPTHKALRSLVQDEQHLYFMDPNWTADLKGGVDILQLSKKGGPPKVLGSIREGGDLWVDGDHLYIVGGFTGAIHRIRVR